MALTAPPPANRSAACRPATPRPEQRYDVYWVLRTDNGPEFLGETFVQRAKLKGMAIQYIQPGKPNENAYVERFNLIFREDILDQHVFVRLADVREAAWWCMVKYNEQRPHDSLDGMKPIGFFQLNVECSSLELSA